MKKASSEIVFGIVCPIGTNVEPVMRDIEGYLKQFNYRTEIIDISESIISQFSTTCKKEYLSEFDRVNEFIELGNLIRERSQNNAVLMEGAISKIFEARVPKEKSICTKKRAVESIKIFKIRNFVKKKF